MKKLIFVLLFLIYFLTSIVYIDLYEFKNVRNMLWKDNNVSILYMSRIKNINTPKELISILENTATKYKVNISKVVYKKKTNNGKRKIKIYTTCNDKAFDNIRISVGRRLKNEDLSNKFISSELTNSKDQLGKINFFSLDSIINIYNLSAILYNGESIGGGWFIDNKDQDKLSFITNDLKEKLKCEDIEIYNGFPSDIDYTQSNEAYHLRHHMIGVLIVLYVMAFIIMIYWLFSRHKELSVRKMFGESNISLKLKIIFQDLLKYHIYCLSLSGLIIFSFLIYKVGLININLFFLSWLNFIFLLTLISLCLMFIPLIFIKYIEIPLMLKNKRPVKAIKNINNISKCLIGISVITVIINVSNSLYILYSKNIENKIWDNSLNYSLVKKIATFSDVVSSYGDEEKITAFHENMKKWFKACNQKGAIYINARNYKVGTNLYEKQTHLRNHINRDKLSEIMGKSIKVNNNYLQLNPIYDINGNMINIPDHDKHTLNLLVPNRLKKYDTQIRKKYTDEFYSNGWSDYKLNIIYIKNNQKCFTYQTDLATETKNYVIGSIIQVISNNNMHLDSYGCCNCNGFYPRITNIDNPYQELLPDMKSCGVDKSLFAAETLYEAAAKNVYETEQQFINTIEYMIFIVILILTLIISTCINYLEEHKIENLINKLHGVGFIKRINYLIKNILLMWVISIFLIIVINYNSEIVDKIIFLLYLPNDMILIDKLIPGSDFYIECINWKIVFGIILGDIFISTIILKIYENKNTNNIIKGK